MELKDCIRWIWEMGRFYFPLKQPDRHINLPKKRVYRKYYFFSIAIAIGKVEKYIVRMILFADKNRPNAQLTPEKTHTKSQKVPSW